MKNSLKFIMRGVFCVQNPNCLFNFCELFLLDWSQAQPNGWGLFPLDRALIGGAQPIHGWWASDALRYKNRSGGRRHTNLSSLSLTQPNGWSQFPFDQALIGGAQPPIGVVGPWRAAL